MGGETQLYRYWQIVSPQFESFIEQATTRMPLACSIGYEPESLLRHFAQVCLNDVLNESVMRLPQVFLVKFKAIF